jgi:hypothetical protein
MPQSHQAAMAQAPTTLKLKSGETFIATPLTEKDQCELEDWARRVYLDNTRRAVKELPAADRDEYMRLALDECQKISIRYGLGQEWLVGTVKGLCRLSYQFIKKNCNLTAEQWEKKFFPEGIVDHENMEEFNFVMQHLTPKIPEPVKQSVEKEIDPYNEIQKKNPNKSDTN